MKPLPTWEELHGAFRYEPSTGWLVRKNVRTSAKRIACTVVKGYYTTKVNGLTYYVHRVVWKMVTGKEPPPELDHINNIKTDNRIENLRGANGSQNQANKPPKQFLGTSRYKGVCWHKRVKKWCAQIGDGKRPKHIGYFSTEEKAAKAYNEAAKKFHGAYARLNEVDS